MYQLNQAQVLQASKDEPWEFISRPIKYIVPARQFVDEQRIGPYGLLGKMVNGLMISRRLDSIFGYRKEILEQQFN